MPTLHSKYDHRQLRGVSQINVHILRETPVPAGTAPSLLGNKAREHPMFPLADTPEIIVSMLRAFLVTDPEFDWERETFFVLMLNTRRRLICWQKVSIGNLDTLLVSQRDVFRAAIVTNAAAVIMAHTHPSGDSTPSGADITITQSMVKAGRLLQIEVLDHIIIANPVGMIGQGWSSLRESGLMYS